MEHAQPHDALRNGSDHSHRAPATELCLQTQSPPPPSPVQKQNKSVKTSRTHRPSKVNELEQRGSTMKMVLHFFMSDLHRAIGETHKQTIGEEQLYGKTNNEPPERQLCKDIRKQRWHKFCSLQCKLRNYHPRTWHPSVCACSRAKPVLVGVIQCENVWIPNSEASQFNWQYGHFNWQCENTHSFPSTPVLYVAKLPVVAKVPSAQPCTRCALSAPEGISQSSARSATTIALKAPVST